MNGTAIGETDLRRLLGGLAPELAERPRAIRSQAADVAVPADAIMSFREKEGITTIVAVDEHAVDEHAVDEHAIGEHAVGEHAIDESAIDASADEPLWAQITLRIHSSLEAVGMMAAIAAALTARDIPCNAVSAYYHDHLFVPWQRRDDTLAALQALTGDSA